MIQHSLRRAARTFRVPRPWLLPILAATMLGLNNGPAKALPSTIQITYTDADGEGFFDHTVYTKPPYSAANPTTLGEARRAAFEAAAGKWGTTLVIKVPITISASLDPLTGNATSAVLGSAGANYYLRNGSLPVANTWYPAALGDTLAGADQAPGTPMIIAQFNSAVDNSTVLGNISWYYGTDGNGGSDVDFYEVVLHEFGHGLGFQSFISSSGAFFTVGGVNQPTSYDRFLAETADAGAVLLMNESSVQRGISIIGGSLYFAGSNTRAANGGVNNARIYAPNPYQSGSSTSHLDYNTYRNTINSLMSPIISNVVHDAGPVGNGVFKDIGWSYNVAPVASNQNATVFVDTPATVDLSATDANSQPLTYAVVSGPSHGTVSAGTGASRTYTPAPGYDGPDSFTFKANDGALDSNTATVTITVKYQQPVITDFTPTSGIPGSGVTITGLHFAHGATVKFNGVTAASQPNTDTQISATVPGGATTGPITVVAQGGTVTTATNFTVIPASQPTGQTTYARNVTGASADLHATINPGNQSTTAFFQWGQTLPYDGGNTPSQGIGSGGSDVDVTSPLTGLSAGTTYHYRAKASNHSGDVVFGDSYFVTLAPGGGTALQFDGATGNVSIPGFGLAAPTTDITIEFWQKVDAAKQQSTFIMGPDDITNRINAHVPWSDGAVYWDFGNINTGGRLSFTPPDPIVGSWQHFAFVASQQSGGYMAIYRNGVLEAQKPVAGSFTHVNSPLLIGGSGGFQFGGQIDEFRVWNFARDGNAIQHDMHHRLIGNEPGLMAYYRFDDGAGVTPVDSSPSGLNGTLAGGATWVASTAPIGTPVVTTLSASSVTLAGATLNGTVNPSGLDTTAWLEWGTSTAYGTLTTSTGIGAGTEDVAISAPLSGLLAGTTYHFRAAASNATGTFYGLDHAFTTPALYTVADATKALQAAGGLYTPTADEYARWNVEPLNNGNGGVDIVDAIRIARKAAGTDANP